jgi:hypothetical protein
MPTGTASWWRIATCWWVESGSSGYRTLERPANIGEPFEKEVVDRPLSLRRRTEVPAPPFFDLPLFVEVCFDFPALLLANGVPFCFIL